MNWVTSTHIEEGYFTLLSAPNSNANLIKIPKCVLVRVFQRNRTNGRFVYVVVCLFVLGIGS